MPKLDWESLVDNAPSVADNVPDTQQDKPKLDWEKLVSDNVDPLKMSELTGTSEPVGKPHEKYSTSDSWLSRVLNGLDYLVNINRSGIRGLYTKNETYLGNAYKAAKQEIYTPASELRTELFKAMGSDTGAIGLNDGRFQWGDVADFAADVGVDLMTDPLTLLSVGLSSVSKGVGAKAVPALAKISDAMNAHKIIKGAKGADEAMKIGDAGLDAIKAVKLADIPLAKKATELRKVYKEFNIPRGSPTKQLLREHGTEIIKQAAKWNNVIKSGRPTIGGLFGYASSDPDAHFHEKLLNAGFGAALVYGGKINLAKVGLTKRPFEIGGGGFYAKKLGNFLVGHTDPLTGRPIKGAFDAITDHYYKVTKGVGVPLNPIEAERVAAKRAKKMIDEINKQYTPGEAGEIERAVEFTSLKDKIKTDLMFPMAFSDAARYTKQAMEKTRNIDMMIQQGRYAALDGLTDAEKLTADTLMHDFKNEFTKRRRAALVERKIDPESVRDINKHKDVVDEISRKITTDMEQDFVPGIMARQSNQIKRTVNDWTDHNLRVVDLYNKETQSNLFGIKWHVDDVYKTADQNEVSDLMSLMVPKKAKLQFAKGGYNIEQSASKILSPDKSYAIYSNNMAKKFLNKKERQAMRIMAQIQFTDATKPDTHRAVLKGWDSATKFLKANLLQFSMTWLKNNYFDNLFKAYMESGVTNALKTGFIGADRKLLKDIWSVAGKDMRGKFAKEDLQDSLKRGVLENPMFNNLNRHDPLEAQFLFGTDKFNEIASESRSAAIEGLKKGAEKWENFLGGTVGRVGTTLEGTARMTTYTSTVKHLKESGLVKQMREELKQTYKRQPKMLSKIDEIVDDKIKNAAADITKRAFFDYGNVTHLEQSLMKRLIPFYSFYSKNLPYWMEAATNIEKIGRLSDLDKFRRNLGREPTSREQEGLSTYLQQNAARVVGMGKRGKRYAILPYMAAYDAAQMMKPTTFGEQIKEKLTPFIKTPLELSLDRDWFTGGFLLPSSHRTQKERLAGKKGEAPLFTAGYKWSALQSMIDKIPGVTPSSLGIKIDQRGNPVSTSDNMTKVNKIFSTLFPMGLVDQLAGSLGKVKYGKSTMPEEIIQKFSPVKFTEQRPKTEAYLRKMRRRSKNPLED